MAKDLLPHVPPMSLPKPSLTGKTVHRLSLQIVWNVRCLSLLMACSADVTLSLTRIMRRVCRKTKSSLYILKRVYTAPTDALAHPTPEHTAWQVGLKPSGFKALVGKGHPEFATMRQQDAEEFFSHLLTVLRRFNHTNTRGLQGIFDSLDRRLELTFHTRT